MATDLGQLVYTLTLNDEGFTEQLGEASSKVKESSDEMGGSLQETTEKAGGLTSGMGGMVGQFVAAQAIFAVGQKALSYVTGAINDGVQAAKDWQTQQQGMNAELKSTGDASGMTADQLTELANKMQDQTPIAREATLAGENMLLTFTGIGKTAFPQATQAVADMATRLNGGLIPNSQQMTNVALQLGKALNDPATGMTMLRREGVTFDAQQQKLIKTMVAAGDTAGAQQLMLNELNKEFGGSAQANMNTYTGQVEAMKNKFNDLVGEGINKAVAALQAIGVFLVQHKAALAAVAGAVVGLTIAIGVGLVAAIWAWVVANTALAISMGIIVIAGAVIALVAYEIVTHWKQIQEFFGGLVSWFQYVFGQIGDVFIMIGQFFTGEEIGHGLYEHMSRPLIDILQFLIHLRNDVEGIFDAVVNTISNAFDSVVDTIKHVFDDIVNFLRPIAIVLLAIMLLPLVPAALAWRLYHKQITDGFNDVVSTIKRYATDIVSAIGDAVKNIEAFFTMLFGFINNNFIKPVTSVIDAFIKWYVGLWTDAFNTVIDVWNAIVGFFTKIMDSVTNAVKGPTTSFGTMLFDAGKSLIDGLIKGIESMAGAVWDKIKEVGQGIESVAKQILGIFSPSKVFADIGQNVSLGLAKGISDNAPVPQAATTSMAQSIIGVGQNLPSTVGGNVNSAGVGGAVYNIQQVVLSTASAVDEFFSIGNRNTALELGGMSPLPGTVGA